MSVGYQAVQSGHAVAQWLLENPKQTWNNNYLIFLTADIERTMNRLDILDKEYTVFKEPDLNNAITAIAYLGDGKSLKNLKLLGN